MSRRNLDMNAEQILSNVSDFFVWNRLEGIENIEKCIRETDKNMQIRGTDVKIHTKNGNIIRVDEKAQLYYINESLPTFAFELDFIRRDGIQNIGWFANPNLDTDMYMLIYPYAKTKDLSKINYSDFTKLECILISKNVIWRELINNNLFPNFLLNEANKMRNNKQIGKQNIPNIDWAYLYLSDPEKYTEAPTNIVIRKEKLLELANQAFIATPKEVTLYKGPSRGLTIETNLFGKIITRKNLD